ncbi:MAG: hypothetical protein HY922_15635 [Elusimicrobia bacterium]|nr:hypothetical protein [Elusimicrobiota bacterium]
MKQVVKKRGRKFGLLEYLRYLKSPEVAITAAAIAGAAVFHARLQAKNLSASPFIPARLESPESALLKAVRGAESGGPGPAGKQADDPAKAMAEYGQSSVRYVDGRAEPPAGGRVFYDDVVKGAGQTIKGVLRLADARKLPEGVDFWENEFKEALESRRAAAAAAGALSTAAKAQDVLAPGGEPAAGGASGADAGAAHVRPTDDLPALVANEMPEGTQTLASPQAASSYQGAGAGETPGRLASFSRESGVKRVDQPITLPRSTLQKIPIYQLTTTEVYSSWAAQHSGENEFETSTEETGLVFDGKQPNCQHCDNKAMAGPGSAPSVGGGALNSGLWEQAQELSDQVG